MKMKRPKSKSNYTSSGMNLKKNNVSILRESLAWKQLTASRGRRAVWSNHHHLSPHPSGSLVDYS
jgi:hypothetical protein